MSATLGTIMLLAVIGSVRAFSSLSLRPVTDKISSRDVELMMAKDNANNSVFQKGNKGKILVLGGSGFLGGTIAQRAALEGYSVTSLSRRGKPEKDPKDFTNDKIDYRIGDARESLVIENILDEGNYTAIFHCIGILLDGDSGLRSFNRFVSGSGSVPEENATYDEITRLTAFNAIAAAESYVSKRGGGPLPFIFTSAAEAGWPDVRGGKFVERTLTPRWLKRYLEAKRSVENRLMNSPQTLLRPVIFRPSLIYSLDKIASLPPWGAFFVGNRVGLPFVDRPVSVQTLSTAAVRSISKEVRGVQRFKEIDQLSK